MKLFATTLTFALAAVALGVQAQDVKSPYDDPAVMRRGMDAAARGQNEITLTDRERARAERGIIPGVGTERDARRSNRDERRYYNSRDLRRGDRLPAELRGRQYVVDDYRAHRLDRPGRGQQWVQVGSDYALVSAATGVIGALVQGR